MLYERANLIVRRPSFLHSPLRLLADLLRPLPPSHCLFAAAHQFPHCLPHLLGRHRPDRDPDPQHVDDQLLVDELLREERPRDHRHARAGPLQQGIPPAVRHEPPDRAVAQNGQLRRPPVYDHALLPFPEPCREELRQVAVISHDPDKRVLRIFESQRDLAKLGHCEPAEAPEAHVDHRSRLLAIQPIQDIVVADGSDAASHSPVFYIRIAHRHRPDEPHLHAAPLLHQIGVIRLQIVEAVHHRAVALPVGFAHADESFVGSDKKSGEARARELDVVGEAGDGEGLVAVGIDFLLAEEGEGADHDLGEAAGAVEDDARHAEHVAGPREVHVGDDAVRSVLPDEVDEGALQQVDGGGHLGGDFGVWEGEEVLEAVGEAGVGGEEGEGEQPDGVGEEGSGVGEVEDGADEGEVAGGGDDGGFGAAGGADAGEVDHGDHVARREEGQEEDVHVHRRSLLRENCKLRNHF
ncbi:hypothetical protein ACMD2_11141 [Ananas comosus]|uniref:Uncharacterized protein n=1 Tax=Ananas comosus TaxID=4615 RepID=A0A199VEF5_ANACO|nr:hypothetical protein ACMD2_11141 [Ananas comosus]